VVVNDGSLDEAELETQERAKVITYPDNLGFGFAYILV
jgi:hypothetical protein